MSIKESFTKLIAPLLAISGIAICLPFVVAFINMKVVGKCVVTYNIYIYYISKLLLFPLLLARTNPELRVKLVQIAYPTALVGIGTYYLAKIGTRISRRLTETIREDNYLVGRTLHNLDH